MKGKRIEPGCLAMIVGVKHPARNNGLVVRVIGSATGLSGDELTPPEAWAQAEERNIRIVHNPSFRIDARRWWVESVRGELYWCTTNLRVSVKVKRRSYLETHLIRLDDDETPEETHTTEQHKEKV